jgi:hypothetical protein
MNPRVSYPTMGGPGLEPGYCQPAQRSPAASQPKFTPQFSSFGSGVAVSAIPEIRPVSLGLATNPMLLFGPPRVPRSVICPFRHSVACSVAFSAFVLLGTFASPTIQPLSLIPAALLRSNTFGQANEFGHSNVLSTFSA